MLSLCCPLRRLCTNACFFHSKKPVTVSREDRLLNYYTFLHLGRILLNRHKVTLSLNSCIVIPVQRTTPRVCPDNRQPSQQIPNRLSCLQPYHSYWCVLTHSPSWFACEDKAGSRNGGHRYRGNNHIHLKTRRRYSPLSYWCGWLRGLCHEADNGTPYGRAIEEKVVIHQITLDGITTPNPTVAFDSVNKNSRVVRCMV